MYNNKNLFCFAKKVFFNQVKWVKVAHRFLSYTSFHGLCGRVSEEWGSSHKCHKRYRKLFPRGPSNEVANIDYLSSLSLFPSSGIWRAKARTRALGVEMLWYEFGSYSVCVFGEDFGHYRFLTSFSLIKGVCGLLWHFNHILTANQLIC